MPTRLLQVLAICTTIAMSATIFTGCGNKDSSKSESNSSEVEVLESEPEKIPETDEEWQTAMIDKSLYSFGNTTKMQEKIQKAQAGDEVTVAYLGGSITEGVGGGPDDCYAKLSFENFAADFGAGENVKYVNAGISGTPSKLGILRLERDVLQYNPDICFVEFAVNDGGEMDYQNSYESIVRDLIDRDVAVILLFSITEDGHTCQEYMKAIGEHYQLPMISYADSLTYMFDNDKMTWKDFSDDQSHPNMEGHKLVAEMINNYFNQVMDQPAKAYTYPTEPLNSPRQQGAHLYENTDITPESLGSWAEGSDIAHFTNGWTYKSDSDNEPLKFKVTGKFIYIVYREMGSGNYGTADVKVVCNGEEVNTIPVNAVSSSGWGNPQLVVVGMEPSNSEYEIEIKMAEGSESSRFEVLGIACTLD